MLPVTLLIRLHSSCIVFKMVENNFYKTVKTVTIICRYLGILPFSYIDDKVVLSKYVFLYNLILLILTTWLSFKIGMMFYKENVVEEIVDMTFFAVNQFQFVVTLIKSMISKENWLNLVNTMSKTDKLFEEIGVQLPDQELKRKMYISFIGVFVFISFGFIMDTQLNAFATYTEYLYFYIWLSFNCSLGYCTALYIIRIHDGFKAVNTVLKERIINVERDKHFKSSLKVLVSSTCIVHHSLTKLLRTFNECFGITLLVAITASFLMIVNSLYDVYNEIKRQNILLAIETFMLSSISILCNFFLSHLCEIAVDEVLTQYAFIVCQFLLIFRVKNQGR